MPADNLTETPTLKQQILSTKIKVLSRVCATKNELKQPTNEIEETIYVTEYNSGTEYVKPSNNTKPRQETFSENKTPKELLPP
jgi:hypothetical protein